MCQFGDRRVTGDIVTFAGTDLSSLYANAFSIPKLVHKVMYFFMCQTKLLLSPSQSMKGLA